MKKLLVVVALLVFGVNAPAWAGKFVVNGTNTGQSTDLAITNADSTTTKRVGVLGTIDLGSVTQADATKTTTPVIALSQSADGAAVFGVTCTQGQATTAGSTCTCYTTTSASKKGTIKIRVNGVDRYIDFKNSPN